MRQFAMAAVLAACVLASALAAGCDQANLKDYGIVGYEVYTRWIAESNYWPDGTPRLSAEQQRAFAVTSWAEHERVYDYLDQVLGEKDLTPQ